MKLRQTWLGMHACGRDIPYKRLMVYAHTDASVQYYVQNGSIV
jgi:hypothetical protein